MKPSQFHIFDELNNFRKGLCLWKSQNVHDKSDVFVTLGMLDDFSKQI